MAVFQLNFQKQDGSFTSVNSTDNIWLTGTTFSTPIIVGSYQDGTHLSDVNNIQRDQAVPGINTKFLTASTVSLNSGTSQNLSTLTSGTGAALHFNFSNGVAVATSAATFYAWNGVSATSPMANVTFQAAEVSPNFGGSGTNGTWTAANGSGSGLSLANQSSGTSHDFYIALSASPSAAAALTGNISLALTYA